MKLRIAEKIFKRYLERDTYYNDFSCHQHDIANYKERKAFKICKKFKSNEYWAFHLSKNGEIYIQIGG